MICLSLKFNEFKIYPSNCFLNPSIHTHTHQSVHPSYSNCLGVRAGPPCGQVATASQSHSYSQSHLWILQGFVFFHKYRLVKVQKKASVQVGS